MSSPEVSRFPAIEIAKLGALSLCAGLVGVASWEFGVEHIIPSDEVLRESVGWELFEAVFISSVFVLLSIPIWLRSIRTLSDVRAEAAEKGEMFTEAFLSIPTMCGISNPETGVYEAVNDQWLEVMGFERHEVVGKTSLELGLWRSEGDREAMYEEVKRGGGHLRNFNIPTRSKTGEDIDIVMSGDLIETKDGVKLFLIANNVSPIKAAQQQLRDAIESISDAFVLYDSDLRLVICNQKFKDLYKYSDEEAAPGVHSNYLGELDVGRGVVNVAEEKHYVTRRSASRSDLPETYSFQLSDGRTIQTRDRKTADGGVVSIQSDVTEFENLVEELRQTHADLEQRIADRTRDLEKQVAERTEAEARLRDAFDAVRQADQAKTDFLANVSHELRTPLNAIIGFTSIMRTGQLGEIENARYREYLGDIQTSGEHLLALINDILDVSAVEAGKLTLQESECSLFSIIEDAVRFVATRAANGNVEVTNDTTEASAPVMHLDERRTLQVLVNVLNNAVKFTPGKGNVRVESSVCPVDGVTITVTDTGVGMTKEEIGKALQPFTQIENQLTREHEGTGLGLPLTHALVGLHGGQLAIDSIPDQGTALQIKFPASRIA